MLVRYMHGVSDYDFTTPSFNQFDPPLTEEEKAEAATIVDGFKSKDDVVAWAGKNPNFQKGKELSRIDNAVTMLSMQKGLIASGKELIVQYGFPPLPKGPVYTQRPDVLVEGDDYPGQRSFKRLSESFKQESRRDDDTPPPSEEKKPSALPLVIGAAAVLLLLGKK